MVIQHGYTLVVNDVERYHSVRTILYDIKLYIYLDIVTLCDL